MANFKDKIKNKRTIGNREVNASDALGLVFNDSDKKIIDIKISALTQNPYQPRLSISYEELKELADSIGSSGQLQPIIITPIENNPNRFYIIAGHRRVEALKLLNKEVVAAISYQASDEDLRIYAIVENLQRENLTPIEESFAIKSLVDSGMKQIDIVKKLGKSKSSISRLMKISSLDKSLTDYIQENNEKVKLNVLEELSNVRTNLQLKVYKYFKEKSLNVEDLQKYVKAIDKDNIEKINNSFSGFSISKKKNKISFKLDFDLLKDRSEAIKTLEEVLSQLKQY